MKYWDLKNLSIKETELLGDIFVFLNLCTVTVYFLFIFPNMAKVSSRDNPLFTHFYIWVIVFTGH